MTGDIDREAAKALFSRPVSNRYPFRVTATLSIDQHGYLEIAETTLRFLKCSRVFGTPEPWFEASATAIEKLSLHPPHLTIRSPSHKRPLSITFMNPTPLAEVLAELRAKHTTFCIDTGGATPGQFGQSSGQLTQPMGFVQWLFAGGAVLGPVAGSGFGGFGAPLLFAAFSFVKGSSDSSNGGGLILPALVTAALAVFFFALGYSRYCKAHAAAQKAIEDAAARRIGGGPTMG